MSTPQTVEYRELGSSASLADNYIQPYYLDDLKRRVSAVRIERQVYAFDDLCTCGGDGRPCPLSAGLLTGSTVMCQCHGSEFDARTGAVLHGPATEPLRSYPAREVEGRVEISVAEEAR